MLRTKANVKFLLALSIMLVAVFILNMNIVNAATTEEAKEVMSSIPDKVTVNATVIEEVDNIIKNEYQLDVTKIKETITLPKGYSIQILFENSHNLKNGTLLLQYDGKSTGQVKNVQVKFKDEANKNVTTEKEVASLVDKIWDTNFTFKYVGELSVAKANEQIVADISSMSSIDSLKIKILQCDSQNIDFGIYYSIGIFVNDVFYDGVALTQEVVKENTPAEKPVEPVEKPVTSTDEETNIKLDAPSNVVPENTVLETKEVKEEKTVNTVKESLKEVSNKFVTYDITLKSNNVAIQPNGKVKISIPIPSDFDKTKLSVYRVAEDGIKTKYDTKVEGNYATIETDHFSTYVLAENNVVTNNEDTSTKQETTKGEKDNTPKTGTIESIYFILPITIVSAIGIVAFRRKLTK